MEAFEHTKYRIAELSANPEMLGAKLLVRCSSVKKDMWPIVAALREISGDVKIFASASEDADGGNTRSNLIIQNGEDVEFNKGTNTFTTWCKSISRKEYIESIQSLDDTDEAIILHHDTISEGLNVPGFTSFVPLTDKLLSTTKLIQNLGRVIRLNTIDKKRFLNGELEVDGEGWIKPFALMIIPHWNAISNSAAVSMSNLIYDLETNMGAKIGMEIPFGSDIATGFTKNHEGTRRKRPDNRPETLEGIVSTNHYQRLKLNKDIIAGNRDVFNIGEGLKYLQSCINEGNI
jgi:hypothetical protein